NYSNFLFVGGRKFCGTRLIHQVRIINFAFGLKIWFIFCTFTENKESSTLNFLKSNFHIKYAIFCFYVSAFRDRQWNFLRFTGEKAVVRGRRHLATVSSGRNSRRFVKNEDVVGRRRSGTRNFDR
uniref:Ribosomal protein S3 n=1 Tax=Romanomermis culicivorax TaxID=13658 RepID=A0A915IP82_ROMCU